ncbi:7731_t:CDS:2, partial [Funneliformis geosporum]
YDELSESFINVLNLLEVKQKHNLTDHASNDILNIFANGIFFKNDELNNQTYILSNRNWKDIGQLMYSSRRYIPLEFGRLLHDIFKHFNGFKAAEWSNWIIMYSESFLQNKLPILYLKGWINFVEAVKICLQQKITHKDL